MPGPTPSSVIALLHSQLTFHPKVPTSSFKSQTIIVTGASAGLGREAAKHIVRLDAELVILAVRTVSRGEAASKYISEQTGKKGITQVWPLDLSSFESVRAFAKRAKALSRLDGILENAGMWPTQFDMLEGHEATVTVNVLSNLLLARLLLPKLYETATQTNVASRLTIVSSALHKFATLNARNSPSILNALDQKTKEFDMRYQDSKLLLHLYSQKLAGEMSAAANPGVCLDLVNPGYCVSELKPPRTFAERGAERILARSTDEGARILVDAVAADKAKGRHGMYIDDMKVKRPAAWLETRDGQETKERVWKELNAVLDAAASEEL